MKQTVIQKAGGLSELARKLDISRQAIYQWRGIPPHHVLALERITGISRHELRPDYYPPEVAA